MSSSYNFYNHGYVIQTPKYDCSEIHMVYTGGVAVCESSCFEEPILIYGPCSVFNLYQVIMNQKLERVVKGLSTAPS